MESTKTPKSKYDELFEFNLGHTENEWGMTKKKPSTRIFVSYTVSWDA